MKNKKTALLLVLGAILLVAATMFGTVAYLTSTATVSHTFTVGNVAITLDEIDVDEYGDEVENATRVTTNGTYKLIPGRKYTKDPVVHVAANSEKSYLFVSITDEIADLQDTATIAAQLTANGWVALDGVDGVYTRETAVATSGSVQDFKVFDYFKLRTDLEYDDIEDYAGKTIIVKAYAVQADGFATAKAAWTAAGFVA